MGFVDVKVTIWERHYFDDDLIKEHKINEDFINDVISESYDHEYLAESCEEMTPEKNDYQTTKEVYDSKGNLIWTNEPIQIQRDNKIDNLIK